MKWPTATHRFRPGQDTAASQLTSEPVDGVPCLNQRFPFHRTTSGRPVDAPTAVHAEGDEHETPNRSPASRGADFGIVQRAPSHRSTSVLRERWPS